MRATTKPDCYACVHRAEVAGSAHSSCHHPETKEVHQNAMAKLIGAFGKRSGVPFIPCSALDTLRIIAVRHGVEQGWFVWPLNFDPVWLENCDGFTAKAEVAK